MVSVPLDEGYETPRGFYLRRIDGVLWLRGYRADAAHLWSPEDVFVFVRMGLPISLSWAKMGSPTHG